MTVKHHDQVTVGYGSPRCATVYISRSIAKTTLTIAVLAALLLVIIFVS